MEAEEPINEDELKQWAEKVLSEIDARIFARVFKDEFTFGDEGWSDCIYAELWNEDDNSFKPIIQVRI